MVEVVTTYDLSLAMNSEDYANKAKSWIDSIMEAEGLIEFRANRSLTTNKVRTVTLWNSGADWMTFAESPAWAKILGELTEFTPNICTETWGPSPIIPEPLRPRR
jgi:heme-degrading monooxygenase HmoA